jgi:MtN3 and saliva related transmembrane protein
MNITTIAYIIGFIAAILTTGSFFPQAKKSWETRKTKDLSLGMYLILIGSITVWIIYASAPSIMNYAVLFANIPGFFLVGSVLFLILKYSEKPTLIMILLFIAYILAGVVLRIMNQLIILGLLAGMIGSTSNVPQVLKIVKTRETSDISLPFYVAFVTGIALWLIHGIMLADIPIIAANSITLLTSGTVLILKLNED